VSIHIKSDKTECTNYRDTSLLPTTLSSILLSMLKPHIGKIIGIINMDFNVTDQLLVTYSSFRNKSYSVTAHQLFRNFKKAYDSVRSQYGATLSFCILMRLFRLIMKLIMQFSSSSCYFMFLIFKYSPENLVLKHPQIQRKYAVT